MIRPLILPLLKISGKGSPNSKPNTARRSVRASKARSPLPDIPNWTARTACATCTARPSATLRTSTPAFAHIHEKYGDVGFGKAMDFLFNALGNDLATDVPSMETTHLESVHATLEQVRLLQSTHVQCERLLQRWQDVHGVQCGLAPMELLGDLVDLRKEHFLGAMQIDRIVSKAKAPDIEREVLFLQELLNMTRNLPVQLFDGEQGRMKVIDAVQESVDAAIRREDEYLASLGDA